MTNNDNGGSAFPNLVETLQTGDIIRFQSGMTLRDWFAGQALSAIINGWIKIHPETGETWDDMIARVSFDIADAMLEARK